MSNFSRIIKDISPHNVSEGPVFSKNLKEVIAMRRTFFFYGPPPLPLSRDIRATSLISRSFLESASLAPPLLFIFSSVSLFQDSGAMVTPKTKGIWKNRRFTFSGHTGWCSFVIAFPYHWERFFVFCTEGFWKTKLLTCS